MRHLALVVCLTLCGCTKVGEALRGYAETQSEEVQHPPAASATWNAAQWGGFYVQAGDLGLLTTDNLHINAVPWKLLRVLPDVVPEPFFANPQHGWRPDPAKPFQRFGMLTGVEVRGPSQLPKLERDPELPVGYVHGTVHRSMPGVTLELAATSCTTCHGGKEWDARGQPMNEVYWGIPNHSIDFDGLVDAVASAVDDPRATDTALLDAIRKRFPSVSQAELDTYRKYVIPEFRKEVRKSKARWGGLHPWRFGGPGFSHGVAILHELIAPDRDDLKPSDFPPAYVKIPNIYSVTHKPWLLIDGDYVARAEDQSDPNARFVDFLTGFLPVLGAKPERAVAERPHLEKVRAFLESAEPPKFPGPVDAARAQQGARIYAANCAKCHGDKDAQGIYHYEPSRRVDLTVIETDPTRAEALDPKLAKRFNDTAIGAYMHAEQTLAYAPPPLHGVWAMAPYLHNGSVPTLWDLLNPDERPVRFWVGGHALDLQNVGIAGVKGADGTWDYPPGYVPWSEPKLYDTRQPGKSNAGHVIQVQGLTVDEKRELVEYLKTL